MNVKQRHCMNRRLYISLAALFVVIGLYGQSKPEFTQIKNRNVYLGGGNIAGMRADSVSISSASINGDYTFGEGRRGIDPPKMWSLSLDANTIMHRRKFSMYGAFNFTQTQAYGAFTNMSVELNRFPVDIMEYTPGNKTKQRYAFNAGISVDVADSWRLGARLDFAATNLAKLKDLRYTDFAMDIALRPGVQWLGPKGLNIGANLIIGKSSETIVAEQLGDNNITYNVFLQKGIMYGSFQDWEGGSVHLKESGINGFPISEMSYGAAAQLDYKGLYAEFSYLRADGKVGEKDAIWFRFPVNEYKAALCYRTRVMDMNNVFRVDFLYRGTDLFETTLDKVTEGGVTVREEYGSKRVFRKGVMGVIPSWVFNRPGKFEGVLVLAYKVEDGLSTVQYPYYGVQSAKLVSVDASFNWHFTRNWALRTKVFAGKGFIYDQLFTQEAPVEGQSAPYRSMKDYNNWYDYVNCPYAGASLTPRYTFRNNMYLQLYCQAEYRKYSYRVSTGLNFGYNF